MRAAGRRRRCRMPVSWRASSVYAPRSLRALPVLLVLFVAVRVVGGEVRHIGLSVLCMAAACLSTGLVWRRVKVRKTDRLPWAILAGGMTSWTTATAWGHVALQRYFPVTLADPFWMLLYAAGLVQVILLRSRRLIGLGPRVVLDGLALGLTAVAASIPLWLYPAAQRSTQDTYTLITYVFYPICGLSVLGIVTCMMIAHPRQIPATWWYLGAAWTCMKRPGFRRGSVVCVYA